MRRPIICGRLQSASRRRRGSPVSGPEAVSARRGSRRSVRPLGLDDSAALIFLSAGALRPAHSGSISCGSAATAVRLIGVAPRHARAQPQRPQPPQQHDQRAAVGVDVQQGQLPER